MQLGVEGEDAGELGAGGVDLFVALEGDGEGQAHHRLGAGERDGAAVLVDGVVEAAGGHELVAEVVVHEILIRRRQAAHRLEAAVLVDGAVEVAGDLAGEAEQEGERQLVGARDRGGAVGGRRRGDGRGVGEHAGALEAGARFGVLAGAEERLAGLLQTSGGPTAQSAAAARAAATAGFHSCRPPCRAASSTSAAQRRRYGWATSSHGVPAAALPAAGGRREHAGSDEDAHVSAAHVSAPRRRA